ncbi:bifunctional phosphopantothenoylcysteine decarboxylase/phosphopantothenate--cysteine ligase CoaBC [Brochothrix campestris]|uniref:bifunctional phosphopantothenoylcysteine decarboxylase/phosphopantothenate--cysteine ligase CoaBC n=1 Tax=Brochothrix campestris TaxID=2757 RepID=UPI00054E175C|nr:bifunctional phosphopantothenoylcysteine decarboxylase/phosphopantothenate--cysteine ligase CoaBC [Brochothrix campestris]
MVLGVTGGIASYKAVTLASQLVKAGYEVKVMMTENATQFVTPLTFQVMSHHTVYTDTFIEPKPEKIAHIELADWADLVVIAPATANTISKLAAGIADNMLTSVYLATAAPVWVAPAMNVHMYQHPAVKRQIAQLSDDGVRFIEPSEGLLACGYVGKGRLEEPEQIVANINRFFARKQQLAGKRVLITAGPTVEAIDPVRFLTNRSSGKMGFALANEALALGADVTLVTSVKQPAVDARVTVVPIESAAEMLSAVTARSAAMDIIIKAAAVADYTPVSYSAQKIKKAAGDDSAFTFKRTVDILKTLGENKPAKQVLVGFAAESQRVEENARKKLVTKKLDMVIANDISRGDAGFGVDTNEVLLITPTTKRQLPLLSKTETAHFIWQGIIELTAIEVNECQVLQK